MDTPRTFLCILVHPRLFPSPITDPGNPLRMKMLIEVGPQALIIRASAPIAKGKVMGTETLTGISRVSIERVVGSTRRLEILRRSLLRMALVGGIVLVFTFFVRAYPLGLGVLMALAIAGFAGSLNFLLNGGLGRQRDVFRFYFTLSAGGRPFYLEVPPTEEPELHRALLAAGLRLEDSEASQQTWTCADCDATVDAAATGCPHCGAEFED
jgi:hypothetical protein